MENDKNDEILKNKRQEYEIAKAESILHYNIYNTLFWENFLIDKTQNPEITGSYQV